MNSAANLTISRQPQTIMAFSLSFSGRDGAFVLFTLAQSHPVITLQTSNDDIRRWRDIWALASMPGMANYCS